jgi:hypothetical protein
MNSENLGARITENGALDQKRWALEAFRGKVVFLGVFWSNSRILEWWKVLAQKTGALAKFGKFSRIFVDFWSGLGPFCNYFLETEGVALIFPNA